MQNRRAEGSLSREFMESFLRNPLPETICELDEQIARIEEMQRACADAVRDLMAREDITNGIVFPQEIHELQQKKNMLETHKQYRRVRRRRLQMQHAGM